MTLWRSPINNTTELSSFHVESPAAVDARAPLNETLKIYIIRASSLLYRYRTLRFTILSIEALLQIVINFSLLTTLTNMKKCYEAL